MHQRGRGVIQQVSVVDPEQQRPPTRPLGEQLGGPAEGVEAIVAEALGRGQQVGDAPNGIEAAARVAATHSTSHPAASARARASRASLVLPTPAVTGEHHTAGGRVRKYGRQHLEARPGAPPAAT